ncbi:hypothetical protein B0G69_6596 [Paraburkholderia sp. RAU2J]|nr:hypothetical protein B0G69_6596 [Paraburkholderia sp. RAU2J]
MGYQKEFFTSEARVWVRARSKEVTASHRASSAGTLNVVQ